VSKSVLPAIGLKLSRNSDAFTFACNSSNNPLRIVAVLIKISRKQHHLSPIPINNRAYSYIFFLLSALLVKQQISWSTRSLLVLDMRACSRSCRKDKYQIIICVSVEIHRDVLPLVESLDMDARLDRGVLRIYKRTHG
jgi:hypothetical protein